MRQGSWLMYMNKNQIKQKLNIGTESHTHPHTPTPTHTHMHTHTHTQATNISNQTGLSQSEWHGLKKCVFREDHHSVVCHFHKYQFSPVIVLILCLTIPSDINLPRSYFLYGNRWAGFVTGVFHSEFNQVIYVSTRWCVSYCETVWFRSEGWMSLVRWNGVWWGEAVCLWGEMAWSIRWLNLLFLVRWYEKNVLGGMK